MSARTHFGGRTLARSQALQLLFQAEATGRTVYEVLEGDYALSEGPLDPFGEMLARGADDMRSDLDAVIEVTSSNWSISRMSSVDRNLLRLALYEMLEVDEVAVAVTIDESVELAKAYGSDDSFRFINGLLGRVARRMDEGVDVVAAAREELAARNAADQQDAEDVEDVEAQDADEDATDVEDAATESVTDDTEDGE
ncbi:transcription antitermination factor NusB [Olsenella intestinalis]|uniref:transcription antitermination factor NusB n=1 Tax=Olsenella intestinalis TaxID=2930083 RepID=UPI00200FF38F